ncbi:MAG: radical SAM family heme chaperone HemW [Thalassotalea sp.]|nr:radical SAM family heme chaperone HemW [Thalassotalea sp.]
MTLLVQQPLSLYIHIPWCVEKCPYCDFNSHTFRKSNGQQDIPEMDYVDALIKDLDDDIDRFNIAGRTLHSIFIGGGTPSLFSPEAIASLLEQVYQRLPASDDMEVTLEANPGTVEAGKFSGFADAGVTRLSIGVQSFASDKLIKLGRIHDTEQALNAAALAKNSGVKSFNLDLMHGLPNQSVEGALDDLQQAIALGPDHLSWYQLTIEPNTAFASKPPKLPQDETLWTIQEQGSQLLKDNGFTQYEISAFSQPNKQSAHNLNYWRFGDYLGIGCGAHGKVTNLHTGEITRTIKVKHPKGYLTPARAALDHINVVQKDELPFEFMMNQLRLREAFPISRFSETTGLETKLLDKPLSQALIKGLLSTSHDNWQVTPLGHRYLNDLLEMFL